MADNETRVVYKAIADFASASRAARKLRKELAELRAEEAAGNSASTAADKASASSSGKAAKATKDATKATKESISAIEEQGQASESVAARVIRAATQKRDAVADEAAAFEAAALSADKHAQANERGVGSANKNIAATDALTASTRRSAAEHTAAASASSKTEAASAKLTQRIKDSAAAFAAQRRASRDSSSENVRTGATFDDLINKTGRLQKGLAKIGNFRPRLTPPFVALVPAIAGLIGLVNPLIALLGAGSAVVIGFASSLGTLAGAALALPGLLSGVAAGISSIIVATGGVGNVFKSFNAMKKQKPSAAAAGTSEAQKARDTANAQKDIQYAQTDLARAYEDSAEAISDAERSVEKAQKAAKRAQDNLNDARREALEDLINLREEVSRAGLSEERAIANLVKAQEEYNDVMADPGSTRGDKLDAAADVKEAEKDLADTRKDNIKNAADLVDAERRGVEGSEKVLDARENLTDATEAESDAVRELQRAQQDQARTIEQAQRRLADSQDALNKARSGPDAARGAVLEDEYQKALAKLSPSAKTFVLGILAMQGAWESMQRAVQESFFSEIVDDLDEINGLIPVFGNLWEKAAGAMGRVSHEGIQMVSSGPWTRDFGIIAENNVGIIEGLGGVFLSLLQIVKDVTVAAGPFTQGVVDRWEKGAESLSKLVAAGRESGDIASYLERVEYRLGMWWQIIKNIGATLLNYGSAASEFGDWLTAGFVEMTAGWKKASEEAKQEGSPFKQWLDDTKPVLSTLRSLFGTFFGWLAATAADPENLKSLDRILILLRDDLGPALARLFDSLNDSGLAEDLIRVLTDIVDVITDLVEAGGGDGFSSFVDTLEKFFNIVSWIVGIPGAGAVISTLATALGVIAGLSFVGKFSGLTALLGWLLKTAKSKSVKDFMSKLGGWAGKGGTGVGGAGSAAAAAGGAAVGAESTAVTAAAARAAARREKAGLPPLESPVVTPASKRAAEAAAAPKMPSSGKAGSFLGRLGGRAMSGAKGGIGGLIASMVAGTIMDEIVKDGKGGARDTAGSIGGGALSGAGIGALVGSVVPGVGTAIGAGVGGVVGGGIAAAGIDGDQWAKTGEDIKKAWDIALIPFNTFTTVMGSLWDQYVTQPLNTAATNIGNWWNENVVTPWNTAATNVSNWWNENVVTPFNAFAGAMERGWNELVVTPWNEAAAQLRTWWEENVATKWNEAVAGIQEWWQTEVNDKWNEAAAGVRSWWQTEVAPKWNDAAAGISDWWTTHVSTNWDNAATSVRDWWTQNVAPTWNKSATDISSWWTANVSKKWDEAATNFRTWVEGFGTSWDKNVWQPIKGMWEKFLDFDLSKTLTNFFDGLWPGGGENGKQKGDASRSVGGPTVKRVQSLLGGSGLRTTSTYRTPAENRAVGGVPNSYHTDRANPAIDIAGSVPAMDRMHKKLKEVGGWRQLLYRVKGHYDHIHVANQGGRVPGVGSRDTVPSMLTPGEFVIRKGVVNKLGAENLAGLNAGTLGLADMIKRSAQAKATKPMPMGAGSSAFLNGGGLVPRISAAPTQGLTYAPTASMGSTTNNTSTVSPGITYGQVTIINPVREEAGESLARLQRNSSYLENI
jgi:hypothetical protein